MNKRETQKYDALDLMDKVELDFYHACQAIGNCLASDKKSMHKGIQAAQLLPECEELIQAMRRRYEFTEAKYSEGIRSVALMHIKFYAEQVRNKLNRIQQNYVRFNWSN